jgi:hypothetical protein
MRFEYAPGRVYLKRDVRIASGHGSEPNSSKNKAIYKYIGLPALFGGRASDESRAKPGRLGPGERSREVPLPGAYRQYMLS